MRAICKVCELLDKDTTIKDVVWCNFCQASMCEPCERNWLRRAEAMILSKLKTNENN
jgi:hypothetical protein